MFAPDGTIVNVGGSVYSGKEEGSEGREPGETWYILIIDAKFCLYETPTFLESR